MTKIKLQPSLCIVVFFDIYGFSEIVRDHNFISKSAYKTKSLQSLLSKIINIWQKIDEKINKDYNITYFFSDCGFIIYPINDKDKDDKLYHCLQDSEIILDYYLENNFFVRGGISIGNVSFSDKLLVGVPVIDAVRYESICPGPFIILPEKEINKIYSKNSMGLSKPVTFPTKNNLGLIKGIIILPTDIHTYKRKIREYSIYHQVNGPWEFAKFWSDTSTIVENLNLKE